MTTPESIRRDRRKPADKSPAFQLYTKDLLSDGNVMAMDLPQFGAYVKLLLLCWNEQGLLDDLDRMSRQLNTTRDYFDQLWTAIAPCFYLENGRWQQKRLDEERRKQAKYRRAMQLNGRKGGRRGKAAVKPQLSDGLAAVKPRGNSASSSSSSSSDLSSHTQRALDARVTDITLPQRATAFIDWYEATHDRIIKVGYIGTRNDYEASLRMVAKFTDEQIQDAAIVWLGMDDAFATDGTRTVPKFASRITRCLELIKQRGIA